MSPRKVFPSRLEPSFGNQTSAKTPVFVLFSTKFFDTKRDFGYFGKSKACSLCSKGRLKNKNMSMCTKHLYNRGAGGPLNIYT